MNIRNLLRTSFSAACLLASSYTLQALVPETTDRYGIKDTSAYQRLNLEHDYLSIDEYSYVLLEDLLTQFTDDPFLEEILNREEFSERDFSYFAGYIYLTLEESGFSYKPKALLSEGLIDGELDCDLTSTIYQSVLELYGIDSCFVTAPLHVFLRIEDNDSDDYFNIETNSGEIQDDSFYMYHDMMSQELIDNTKYLRSLTDDEETAIWLNGIGAIFLRNEEYDKAYDVFSESFSFLKTPETYSMLGYIELKREHFDESLRWYDLLVSLDPTNPNYQMEQEKALKEKKYYDFMHPNNS